MADCPDLFEVQKVLSRRTRKGHVQYLIRWKGYGSENDTWEPQGGLVACRIFVNLYNKRHGYPLMGAHGETIRPKKKPNSSKVAARARLNKAKGKKPSPHRKVVAKKHTKLKAYPVRSRENSLSESVNETNNLTKKGLDLEREIKPKSKLKEVKNKIDAKKVVKQRKKSDVSSLSGEKPKGLKTSKSTKVNVKDTDVIKVKVHKTSKQPKVKAVDSAKNKTDSNKKSKTNLDKTKAADAVDRIITKGKIKGKVAKLPKVRVSSSADESSDFDGESEDEDYIRYMLAPALLKKLETVDRELDSKQAALCPGGFSGPKRKKIKAKCDNKTLKILNKYKNFSQETVCNKKKSNCSGKCKKHGKVVRKGNVVRRGSDCSSRSKISPKAAGKLLPMKPLHVKTESAQPVSLPKAPKMQTDSKLQMPGVLDFATIYKTPPTSPHLARSSSNTPSRPSTPVHNGYFADLPTMPLVPTLPSSPSTDSYLSLITDLPQKLQATKLFRRVGSQAEDEAEVKRRVSVRQSESAFKYRDIVVKRCAHYTQIWLFTNTKFRNALNPHVFQELISAFHNAKHDDSRLVLLSGTGRIFCSGIDLFYLSSEDTKSAVNKMIASLREFIKTLISFPKPIVAAVNGPAVGLGAAILPLCDIVYASDKAEFYMPYTRLAQTPEGCASLMFPNVMGLPLANEMLLGGRKLTAIEAYQNNLVSQVYWPTSMMQEVIPKVESMASQSAKALEATKLMVRSHLKAKMDYTNESECNMLYESWLSTDFQRAIKKYLEEEEELLH
ncbi:chromodomain Y-like protein 2 [Lineus longissimus]|uniref:chromodomain Y-like protein 2 n=1 Tax=Lineus longissimus TaxID=88925 RepID=UPI002B4D8272